MNESTQYARTSWLAQKSHFLGVLSLLLLLLCGFIVFMAFYEAGTGLRSPLQTEAAGYFWLADICAGLAVVAALAAIVLGILGLVDIRRGAGKVEGRGQAVSGLVIGTLTLLTPVLGYCVVLPILEWRGRKVESSNNLKQLGLAMLLYHEDHNCFPPPVLRDPNNRRQCQAFVLPVRVQELPAQSGFDWRTDLCGCHPPGLLVPP